MEGKHHREITIDCTRALEDETISEYHRYDEWAKGKCGAYRCKLKYGVRLLFFKLDSGKSEVNGCIDA